MKYNYFYFAVIETTDDGKNYAYAVRVSETQNIINYMHKFKAMNAQPTRKKAIQTAEFWNDCFRRNNTFLFGDKVTAGDVLTLD